MATMQIDFPGGTAVEARFKEHVILTDQPESAGGANAAPAPFDLFLASVGTCAGFYALEFCRRRNLPTEGLRLELSTVKDDETKRVRVLQLRLDLPRGFPQKYSAAIVRAIDQCSVKRHLAHPPEIELTVIPAEYMGKVPPRLEPTLS